MIDITHKHSTLRIATAEAILILSEKSVLAIRKNKIPKGDVFSTAKTAALLAIKNTANVLPHCHPIPIENGFVEMNFRNKNSIEIKVTVKTIYKTGCEMEALHGAAIAALTAYDMLKPIDKNIEITSIKLLQKKGGKSDFAKIDFSKISVAILVVSDSVFGNKKNDISGKYLVEKLRENGCKTLKYAVINDDLLAIQKKLKPLIRSKTTLIITTGGTGLSKRDVTIEAIKPMIEIEIPGIMEHARNYGQQRMPLAFLSRSLAGFSHESMILTFPGSRKAVEEYWNAIMPFSMHAFSVRAGFQHN
jgi:cyclic pyranopterin monophosphate synthase